MDDLGVAAATGGQGADRHGVIYDGRAGELARIVLTNGLLTLITVGFYRFWGKTRVRRYLWSHVSFLGDRLEYSGRGLELFFGFLVILVILTPLVAASVAVDIIFLEEPLIVAAKDVFQFIAIIFLVFIAIYRARRYRLSRTQWRGIRAGQSGSAVKYAFLAFGTGIVMVLTLGLAYPYYRTVLHRYRMRNTWFGNRPLGFDGRARDLFWSWLLTWVLYVPTLSLIHFWYLAKETRYFMSKTSYASLRFASDLRGAQLFWIYLAYILSTLLVMSAVGATVFLLGPELLVQGQLVQDQAAQQGPGSALQLDNLWLAGAIVSVLAFGVVAFGMLYFVVFLHPMIRAFCATLSVFGDEDYAAIAQSQQTAPARGEGLADALDVGAI